MIDAQACHADESAMLRHLEWLAAPALEWPELRLEIAWGAPERGPDRARTFRLDQTGDAANFAAWINSKGCNAYVGATLKRADSPARRRTGSEHAALATCLPLDIDGDFVRGARKLAGVAKPQLMVITGQVPETRGHLWIRLTPTEDMEAWSEVNRRSVIFSGGDRSALGIYRLMRLAGSVSFPSAHKRARGYGIELTYARLLNAPAYNLFELRDRFPATALGQAPFSPNAIAGGCGSIAGALGNNVNERLPVNATNVALVQSMLESLPDKYAIEFDSWLRTGFAIHDFDDGKVGLALWKRFSKRCSKKADHTDFDRRWASLSGNPKGRKISIGWLRWTAQAHGWQAPCRWDRSTKIASRGRRDMSETEQEIMDAIEDGSIADRLSTPLSAEEIDALVENSRTDPGAPFESDVMARIAATKRAHLATFMRLHARLREAGVKVGELDKALTGLGEAGAAGSDGKQGRAIRFREIDPWPETVDGSILLDEIVDQIRRYVMLPPEAANAIALWIMHAYCFDAFTISPRLAITSPEKRCGKTTLLRVVQALVPKPLGAANITAAAMFRTIEKYRPTLLVDEADTFLRDNEELRGVINSGHEREGQVVRTVGDDFEPCAFSTFCPTAIAAIGNLPGTIEDRAITITMRRRLASEPVVQFRSDRADHLHELRRKAARWASDHQQALSAADPDMPKALHDRARDNWRPLMAIADLARWAWPQLARIAAEALSTEESEHDDQSRGVMLLADIRRVFDDRQKMGRSDRLSSTEMSAALHALTDRPWASWGGKPITPAAVARRLKDFRIVPNTIKLSDGKQPNGYKRSQFDDAFARYLPQAPGSPAESSPSSPTSANPGDSEHIQGSPLGASGEVSESAQSLEKQGRGEVGEVSNPQIEVSDESDDTDNDQLAQIMSQARRARLGLAVEEEADAA